ncbi:MAG: hypothetical protein ACI9XK_002610 [Granulosicoccus sp.]|jgi:hypothetical protein
MYPRNTFLVTAVIALLLSSCGSSDPTVIAGPPSASARLVTLGSDAEFYTALRAGLKAQSTSSLGGSGGGFAEVDTDIAVASPSIAPSQASDTAESAAGESGSTDSSRNEVTSTNVQELNVDEQDWVKLGSSGDELYILQSDYSNDFVVRPLIEPLIDIEFSPTARSSIAIPQSYTTKLRVMGLDAETPDSNMISELDVDLSGRYAEGFYLYETADSKSAFISATGNNYWAFWATPTAFSGVDSLITKVDVSDPSSPSVTSSFKFDGQIISSRRIGKHLFFASRYYPTLPGEQPWTQSPEVWAAQVDSADLAGLLPEYRRNDESEGTALIDPSQCFVAGTQTTNYYYSPDIITLAVLDLDTMELTDSQCFLGATETLYASADAVFLATTEFHYSQGTFVSEGPDIAVEPIDTDEFISESRTETSIHQFDINAGSLTYAGTGAVKGHLGWNPLRKPFRMSEKDGYLRVATLNDEQGGSASPILLTVLLADGQGSLETVSTLPNSREPAFIGKPGEQLYASRFLGDRAYLVTFRQTDPLYIVDLADPTNPSIAGELEIEGYSDYLQPIGEDYLLGIGKDAVAASDGVGDGRGALVQGVKLSLFNVSNPASPTEVQSVLIGQRGTHSNALSDHRAITLQPATDAHPLRVSFGIDVYGESSPERVTDENSAFRYYDYRYSGLHGFEIKVGTDAEIVSKGVLRVNPDVGVNYGAYGVDRSVMVNDALFYITGSGVSAANWGDLANPSQLR